MGFIWLPPYMHRAAVAHLCGFIILIQDLCVDPVQLFSWKQAQKLPSNIQGIDDRPVVVGILADEPLLKGLSEFQILLIQRGEFIFSDNRGQGSGVSYPGVAGKELVGHVLMIFPGIAFTNAVLISLDRDGRTLMGG